MPEHVFTPDQIVDGIHKALSDGHMEMVPGLISLLARQDPRRAQEIRATIEYSKAVSTDG